MALTPGSRLGHYEILALLDVGGMGEVYRARDEKLARDVAIKVLPPHLTATSDALARFEREAKAVAALTHPNILAIHDFGTQDGVAYAVMELLDGETLREKLAKGAIPRKQVVDLALQVARGLAAAHEHGIVHRDLKPENIFVTRDGLKILDFGLAKRTEIAPAEDATSAATEEQRTEPGTVMGTVGYMSPEQVRGLSVDHRSDIFAFGATFYEMLCGQTAFRKGTKADTMSAILRDEPAKFSESGTSVPPSLERIVGHCLEKNREDRFQSAKDIVFALSEASLGDAAGGSRVVAAPRASRRNLLVPVSVGLVVLLAVATVSVLRRRPSPPTETAAPSIAVLPFTNLSDDKNQEYFSDGLSDELMGLLTQVKSLRVAGRTSSFAFKGKTDDVSSIGQKLHVATILEGSVRRSGDQLRVSAQLVNVADGYQIWAESYDRKMKDVFAVQDEIAGAVVEALKLKLLPQERPVSQHRTSNAEAYNQYLLGRLLWSRATPEDFQRSVEAYRKAIALDPSYAAAYAGLAVAEQYAVEDLPTVEEVMGGQQRAVQAADRAISIDPGLGEAYSARGHIRSSIQWNWTGAQEDFDRALALDPGDSFTQWRYAGFLASLGRMPEAITAARKAAALDPLWPPAWTVLGWYLSDDGQYQEARTALQRAVEIDPEFRFARFYLGTTALLERDPKAAVSEFERAGDMFRLTGLAMAEHDLGHREAAKEALNELIARHALGAAYQIAEVYAWRGETESAFDWLERAYAQRDAGLTSFKADPLLVKLRGDPRYTAMLRKMSLPNS